MEIQILIFLVPIAENFNRGGGLNDQFCEGRLITTDYECYVSS